MIKRETSLVIGGSGGIGLELVRRLIGLDHNVVVGCRRSIEDALTSDNRDQLLWLPLDLQNDGDVRGF